ncbi:unnamed protein product [Arabis nemorensis]|uniref:Uncharacterized protein n=1 Tax=Arabis nemorensis TaxID=586526 RepID=A0A565AXR8_9BRAS|nr:unnamed protein product [Arabis nemorensis]
MNARSSKGGLITMLILVVYCFFKNMGEPKFPQFDNLSLFIIAEISIEVSPYKQHVGSNFPGAFFALHNKDKMLKSLTSYNEYHKRFNLATVEIWQTIRSRCRDGFINLSIKSMHFFVSKLMQFRYSISVPTPINRSWTSRIVFWVTLTRSVSSMANDTAL